MKTSIDKFREKHGEVLATRKPAREPEPTPAQPEPQQDKPTLQPFNPLPDRVLATLSGEGTRTRLANLQAWMRKHPKLAFMLIIMSITSFPMSLVPMAIYWVWFLNREPK